MLKLKPKLRMIIVKSLSSEKLVEVIKKGGVGVIPTDTIYGLVGKALSRKTIKRVYKLKQRNPKKPSIILIGKIDDLKLFRIKLNENTKKFLQKYWPGKVSVILPCPYKKFSCLHRGTKTLAFRLPNYSELVDLLKKTGPLIAPSANPESEEPAKTIKEAKRYFGEKVDFYADVGQLESLPSTLISIKDEKVGVLRQGEIKI
ncbi:threonylcarbamoyl-AMP synthase [Candidatus Woesebacteria bacterium]|nr:threonylcarbamoyl-AMP synthase [Candidatus Woesebacteria bacterium]